MSATPSSTLSPGVAFDLDHHLGVLRRRWLTVLLVAVAVIGSAAWVTAQQTPQYRTSVRFVVGTLIDPSGAGGNAGNDLAEILGRGTSLTTQTAAIESTIVAERAALLLDSARSPQSLLSSINASLTDQQVLVISATSPDPQEAVDIANAFVAAYLGARNDEAITRLLNAQQQIQERLDRAIVDLAAVDDEIDQLTPAPTFDEDGELVDEPELSPDDEAALAALQAERTQVAAQIAGLERQLADLDTTGTFESAGGQIIQPAGLPTTPFTPQPLRNIGLAVVLGLTLGLGLAYLRDHLDDALRSEHDVQKLVGRPILGRIPLWDHAGRGRVITVAEPASPVSEAYRTLRTNVRFLSPGGALGSVLVTSPAVSEGKTTTAANLAVAFARLGTRVLLVDADLRRPNIDRTFATARTPGLSEVLVGEVEATDALQDVGVKNLRVLPAGTIPPNPSELLGSPAMAGLLRTFESMADLVLVDAPPLLAVSDSVALTANVAHVIMVVQQGSTGRSAVRASVEQLANVNTTVAGVVLNAITEGDGGYQYQYYYREYTAEPEATAPTGRAAGDGEPSSSDELSRSDR